MKTRVAIIEKDDSDYLVAVSYDEGNEFCTIAVANKKDKTPIEELPSIKFPYSFTDAIVVVLNRAKEQANG